MRLTKLQDSYIRVNFGSLSVKQLAKDTKLTVPVVQKLVDKLKNVKPCETSVELPPALPSVKELVVVPTAGKKSRVAIMNREASELSDEALKRHMKKINPAHEHAIHRINP